jgi:TRAP-type mannitol/chloroaromatic compound transport system permease large subunit
MVRKIVFVLAILIGQVIFSTTFAQIRGNEVTK